MNLYRIDVLFKLLIFLSDSNFICIDFQILLRISDNTNIILVCLADYGQLPENLKATSHIFLLERNNELGLKQLGEN